MFTGWRPLSSLVHQSLHHHCTVQIPVRDDIRTSGDVRVFFRRTTRLKHLQDAQTTTATNTEGCHPRRRAHRGALLLSTLARACVELPRESLGERAESDAHTEQCRTFCTLTSRCEVVFACRMLRYSQPILVANRHSTVCMAVIKSTLVTFSARQHFVLLPQCGQGDRDMCVCWCVCVNVHVFARAPVYHSGEGW